MNSLYGWLVGSAACSLLVALAVHFVGARRLKDSPWQAVMFCITNMLFRLAAIAELAIVVIADDSLSRLVWLLGALGVWYVFARPHWKKYAGPARPIARDAFEAGAAAAAKDYKENIVGKLPLPFFP